MTNKTITVEGNTISLTALIAEIKQSDTLRVEVREALKGKRGRPSKYTEEEKAEMARQKALNPSKRGRPAKKISQEEYEAQLEALKAKLAE